MHAVIVTPRRDSCLTDDAEAGHVAFQKALQKIMKRILCMFQVKTALHMADVPRNVK